MTAVAVAGLGAMGSRIAARLVAAGHEVTVWNRSAGKAEPLAGFGAFPAATPTEAVSRAEVLITMVADPRRFGQWRKDRTKSLRARARR
jgi:3-hydroxyisobutyrate dehydrogenase